MKLFKSDNNSGVDPRIMDYLLKMNVGHDDPYGQDRQSLEAKKKICKLFGKEVDIYFVTTGTAANIIALSGSMSPFEGLVTTDTSHINTDECGAFEMMSGSKLLLVGNKDGKIQINDIEKYLYNLDNEHKTQPKIISISQTTELGTLYSLEEISELADFAHKNKMLLHVDGARISNAVVALNSSFKEMITDTGVDLLSFGGTKNGMMIGEAIISFKKDLSKNFKYYRKQGMQLLSKMRFVSGQFIPYLENDLWKENARIANEMGQYLLGELDKIDGVKVKANLETNMVFANIDGKLSENLAKELGLYPLNKAEKLYRFVTSFDTKVEEVDQLIDKIKSLV